MDNFNFYGLLDADVASQGNRRIVFQDLGNVIVPIERFGLKIGHQIFITIEEDIVLVRVANVSVIQADGSIISYLEQILGRCGAIEFQNPCGNYVLKENSAICSLTGVPLCLKHRFPLRNGLVISNQLPKHILLGARVGLINGPSRATSEGSLAGMPRAN